MNKSVLGVFVAGMLAGGGGVQIAHLSGAKLSAPPTARGAGAKLLVHTMRVEQPQRGALSLLAYSTSVYTLPDAGVARRDNGARKCIGGTTVARAVSAIEAGCAPSKGWLHVIEFRLVKDGGARVEAYGSTDAGDQGKRACTTIADGVADMVFGEGLACASPVLDEP